MTEGLSRSCAVMGHPAEDACQVVGGGKGARVVVAQDPAASREGVFSQDPGPSVLAQCGQVDGEIVGGGQRVGVVVTQHAPTPNECVFVDALGLLVVAAGPEDVSPVVGGRERTRIVADVRGPSRGDGPF